MPLLFFLIFFPLSVALLLLYLKGEVIRGLIVKAAGIILSASCSRNKKEFTCPQCGSLAEPTQTYKGLYIYDIGIERT